jgi:hypothetical protein
MTWTDPDTKAAHSVMLELAGILGAYRDNVAICGGWVPPLLLPEAAEQHVGSNDVDLVLDHHRIRGDGYKLIIAILERASYFQKLEDKEDSGRFFQFFKNVTVDGEQIEVRVDLLAGEYGGGVLGGHQQPVQQGLDALKVRGADLFGHPAIKPTFRKLEGALPDGRIDRQQVQITGIVPFVVMKAAALQGRQKDKDSFDVVFVIDHYPGGIGKMAQAFVPLREHGLVQECLATLEDKFASVAHRGPVEFGRFRPGTSPAEQAILAQRAYTLVRDLINAIRLVKKP